jgi:hypothetical protein
MKLLRTTALTAALMTAAVMSITSPAQAQARLAWWGWPGLVAAPGTGNPYPTAYGYYPRYGYGYGTGYNYPAYAYGYGTGYGYPASRYYSSSGGYGMWENPWYSAASHPFTRRHVPLLARAARHWQ